MEDAVKLAKDLKKNAVGEIWDGKDKYHRLAPPYKYPFGIWFRGHSHHQFGLLPTVFREGNNTKEFYQDEPSIVRLFKLTRPENAQNHHTTFEWLSLMQHYSSPTRLLDWTESILVGLYFATSQKDHDVYDGTLWILNAARLNKLASLTGTLEGVASPSRFDVAIRAEMSLSNDIQQLLSNPFLKACSLADGPCNESELRKLEEELKTPNSEQRKKLSYPIAVYPRRLSRRLNIQSGVFTLYGGKLYYNDPNDFSVSSKYSENDPLLPQFKDLFSLSLEERVDKSFLKAVKIPKANKKEIRTQLFELGIHQGSIFGELDYQSGYIKEQWTTFFSTPHSKLKAEHKTEIDNSDESISNFSKVPENK